jgi:hypothetical protein
MSTTTLGLLWVPGALADRDMVDRSASLRRGAKVSKI